MAIVKTRWSSPITKKEEVKPVAPKIEKVIPVIKEENPVTEEEIIIPEITEETTVEEIIANLPKKQRAKKTVVKTEE